MQRRLVHTVDYTQDRLDVTAMRVFSDKTTALQGYSLLVAQLDDPIGHAQKLNLIKGLEYINGASSRVASKNIIDYHFEAEVMTSMDGEQLERYFSHIESRFDFSSVSGLGDSGPLWVDSLHHVCMFSILARMLHHLILSERVDHIVLIHRGNREEPRLAVIKSYMHNTYGITFDLVCLSDDWLGHLRNVMTDRTVVLSMCDVPYEANGEGAKSDKQKGRKSRDVELYIDSTNSVYIECVAGSAALARRFKAHHVVLDFPTNRQAQIRPFDPSITPRCPLDSWVFWPCIAGNEHT